MRFARQGRRGAARQGTPHVVPTARIPDSGSVPDQRAARRFPKGNRTTMPRAAVGSAGIRRNSAPIGGESNIRRHVSAIGGVLPVEARPVPAPATRSARQQRSRLDRDGRNHKNSCMLSDNLQHFRTSSTPLGGTRESAELGTAIPQNPSQSLNLHLAGKRRGLTVHQRLG
jgi:hypothetical protein